MLKRLLGYDIDPGVTEAEYDDWLRNVHVPDLFDNPYLRRVVFNTVTETISGETTFFRIAEMHFDDTLAHDNYVAWRERHPVAPERSPAGRTTFRFYVLADSEVVERPA